MVHENNSLKSLWMTTLDSYEMCQVYRILLKPQKQSLWALSVYFSYCCTYTAIGKSLARQDHGSSAQRLEITVTVDGTKKMKTLNDCEALQKPIKITYPLRWLTGSKQLSALILSAFWCSVQHLHHVIIWITFPCSRDLTRVIVWCFRRSRGQ